jgi:hypothetical protein
MINHGVSYLVGLSILVGLFQICKYLLTQGYGRIFGKWAVSYWEYYWEEYHKERTSYHRTKAEALAAARYAKEMRGYRRVDVTRRADGKSWRIKM